MPLGPQSSVGARLSAIYRQSAAALANFEFLRLGSADTLYEIVARRFPGLSFDEIGQAITLGLESIYSRDRWQRTGLDRKIPQSRIPVDPSLDANFRYILNVECFDPNSRAQEYRTLVVDSTENLTRSDLEARAQADLSQLVTQAKYIAFSVVFSPEYCRINYVASVMRRI